MMSKIQELKQKPFNRKQKTQNQTLKFFAFCHITIENFIALHCNFL